MAGNIYKFIPAYYDKYNNKTSILILTDSVKYRQFTRYAEDFAVATHNDDFYKQMSNCRHHIILAFKEESNVLQKLQDLYFKYAYIEDLHSYYRYYIYPIVFVQCGDLIDLAQAVDYISTLPSLVQRPSEHKKRVKRKAFRSHMPSTSNSVFTQTYPEPALQQRITTILRGRYAHDFYRIVDALCDQHGNFESNNIILTFKK